MVENVVELKVRNTLGVTDCYFHTKVDQTGKKRSILFYVPIDTSASEEVEASIKQSFSNQYIADYLIPLTCIPLTLDGQVDVSTLNSLCIFDQAAIDNNLLNYSNQQNPLTEIAALTQNRFDTPQIYLDEIALYQSTSSNELSIDVSNTKTLSSSGTKQALSDGGELAFPDGAPQVLVECLVQAASGEDPASVIYIKQGQKITYDYAQLLQKASCVLAGLRAKKLEVGTPIIFQVRDNADFLVGFWGCLLGGFIPVPMAVAADFQTDTAAIENIHRVCAMLGDAPILTTSQLFEEVSTMPWPQGQNPLRAINLAELESFEADINYHKASPTDVTLIMLTSGTTGAAKGVPLSHQNLITYSVGSAEVNQLSQKTITLNWMPLDHVAGITMSHLRDVYLGCEQVHVASSDILENPLLWVDLLEKYRVTLTFAPNFGFGLIAGLSEEVAQRKWDLSALKVILNGGEAVLSATARQFIKMFLPSGLSKHAMCPAWGMSETSSAFTYARDFELHNTSDTDSHVSVGPPTPGNMIRITDLDNNLLNEGETGRLQVKGNTVFGGYYKNPEENAAAFTADGWFNTGDLGILVDGKLTITGREKDVIIVNGINYSGPTIENIVEDIEHVSRSYVAACAVSDPRQGGRECLAVFFVCDTLQPSADLLRTIKGQVTAKGGVSPEYLIPLQIEDIPKTSIGKIQRGKLKIAFESGEFHEQVKQANILMGNHCIPAWFFQTKWQAHNPNAFADLVGKSVLIFAEDSSSCTKLLNQLNDAQVKTMRVLSSSSLDLSDPMNLKIRPLVSQDYLDLFEQLKISNHSLEEVLFICWDNLDAVNLSTEQTGNIEYAIAACANGLAAFNNSPLTTFSVVTDRAQIGINDATTNLSQAGIPAVIKTLKQELPHLRYNLIDMDFSELSFTENLCLELSVPAQAKEVAWRNNQRFRFALQSYYPEPINQDLLNSTSGSAYVISGGLGGIGQIITKALLRSDFAQVLILGSRSSQNIASEYPQLEKFLSSYSHLDYVSVDVSDEHKVNQAVNEWIARTGVPLKGVFHLASQYHERALKDESINNFADLSRTKVLGALSLSKIVERHAGAYLINFSSTAGIFGGSLIGAYAAASCVLDALSQNLRAKGLNCVNISWASWQSTGMSANNTAIDALRTRGILELNIEAALTSLRLIMGQQKPAQIIVGIDPDNKFIRQASNQGLNLQLPSLYSVGDLFDENQPVLFTDDFATEQIVKVHYIDSIPRLENGEVDKTALDIIAAQGNVQVLEPKTDTEIKLVQLWKRILKMDTISVDWNFFDVGGQSILATKLIADVRQLFAVEWTLKDIFGAPSCQLQAAAIDSQLSVANSDAVDLSRHNIPVLPRDGSLPLSSAQKRLWFIDQLEIPSSAYNATACIRFAQAPNLTKVESCLNSIIARHESLRVTFPSVGGIAKQSVQQNVQANVRILTAESAKDFSDILITEGQHHFDLSNGPLMRTALIKDHMGQYALALTIHHIISDGWSMKVLFEQFETLYIGNELPQLDTNDVQYADYCAWQQTRIDKGDYDQQLSFWRKQLDGGLTGFEVPTDFPRPLVQTYTGCRFEQTIPALLTGQVGEYASSAKLTTFVLLLTAFKALLSRYTQKQDVMIGTVVANRDYAEINDLIGFFVNPVVLRTQISKAISFEDLLKQVNNVTLDAVANHNVPFEYLVDQLAPPRDTSRSPLFQIAFDLRDPNLTTSQSNDLTFSVMEADLGTSKYDLHLTFEERGAEIVGFWEFNTDLFDPKSISNMAANYQRLLESALNAPNTAVFDLDMLSPAESKEQLGWNQSTAQFSDDLCMHQLFESVACKHPDRLAVVFAEQSINYQTLNARANQLAQLLVEKGAKPGSLIAVCLERSVDAVVSVLAVLKSGAAYIALDPTYPQKRLAFMLEDSGAAIILTRKEIAPKLELQNVETLYFETLSSITEGYESKNLNIDVTPTDLAYVIYTSGSTGTPKGVLLEHKGWCNVAQAQINTFGLREGMRILQFASLSFDASAFELSMAWGSGGTLIMDSKEAMLPGLALAQLLEKHKVQVVTLPPTALTALPEVQLPDLQVITVAGEACPESLVKQWATNERKFFNLYGPTEATIWASYAQCFNHETGNPVIGFPVANTQLYVVDEKLNQLPAGMPGELCIAGVGLARGYLGREELTLEKFVINPFSSDPNSRLYRSGDLVRYRKDGALEFLGRIDHQVKVRGFRIELGEIESLLYKVEGVSEAIVVPHMNKVGETQLIAYVAIANSSNADVQEIRDFLKLSLTDYMVPAHIFLLEKLPLSVNGKVDRKALPSLDSLIAQRSDSLQSAKSDMEKVVSDIWKNVLELESIDINQNFFDIGGHSLNMAQVQTQLSEALKRDISLVNLFQHTSINALSKYLDDLTNSKSNSTSAEETNKQKSQIKSKISGKDRMAKMAALKRRQGR